MSNLTGTLRNKSGDTLFPSTVETISNASGTAIKFSDGLMICTKTERVSIDMPLQSYGIYYTRYYPSNSSLPANFVEDPFYGDVGISCDLAYVVGVSGVGNISKTNWYSYMYLFSEQQRPTIQLTLHYIAIGKWK